MKPFQRLDNQFTVINNIVFDEIMPGLTGSEWKVLAAILRKTLGWNKREDEISYTQLVELSGIRSNTTITKCLTSLEARKLITIYQAPGMTNMISLNLDYQLPQIMEGCRNHTATTSESVEGTTPESVDTKDIQLKTDIYIYGGTPRDGFDYDPLAVPEEVDQQAFCDAFYRWRDYTYDIDRPLVADQMGIIIEEGIELGHDRFAAAVKHSIKMGWKSIHEPRKRQASSSAQSNGNGRPVTPDNATFSDSAGFTGPHMDWHDEILAEGQRAYEEALRESGG